MITPIEWLQAQRLATLLVHPPPEPQPEDDPVPATSPTLGSVTSVFKAEPASPSPAGHDERITVPLPAEVGPAPLDMGDSADIPGAIGLTTRYLTREGKPWIPVMGEYHYSRDDPAHWETELRKMRAGGIDVLATYFFWILHEEVEGAIRWDGARDVRRFIELADRVGLRVVIRIGPWAHGEARNGGFPDWLQALPIRHRTDDPEYLRHVRRWYESIEEQLRGLFHSAENPGGPIIGVQVDNELYDQPGHLETLRRLAESLGIRASLWTATGWGGAQLPERTVLPVYAGYSDGFWDESDTAWPEFGVMHFTFNAERDDLTVGADLRDSPVDSSAGGATSPDDPWPYATCELGGGMHIAYHRRPTVDPDDVAALALTKLGSGSGWQGYYLYHGVTQAIGDRSTTQESHATGYPNDLPIRDYDFGAPLGAAGGERPHFHKLRQQHLLIEQYGDRLATYPTTIAPASDRGPRWAVRADGRRGFLFVNNHQPAVATLPDIESARFTVAFADGEVRVPREPVTLRSGMHAIWPLRQPFGSVPSLTATAQPITEIPVEGRTVVFFSATPGVDVELQFEGVDPDAVGGARRLRDDDGALVFTPHTAPGVDAEVTVGDTTLVFLDRQTAESLWRGRMAGRDSIVLWPGEAWFDEGFRLVHPEADTLLAVYPPLEHAEFSPAPSRGSVFAEYRVPGTGSSTELPIPRFTDLPLAPVRRGGSSGRFSAPLEHEWESLDGIPLTLDAHVTDDVERWVLELEWIGDAIRVYAGDLVIADQFWSGRPLEVDLLPYREVVLAHGLTLKAFAWAPDSEVFVDVRVRPNVDEPVLEVTRAALRAVRSTSHS